MADKLRRTFPIAVTFVDGELPTAAKLNAVSGQARNALAIVERAVGDLWNQSGDPVTSPSTDITANALHLPNLARALGDLAVLNPRIPELPATSIYREHLGLTAAGKTEAYLRFPPAVPSAVVLESGGAPLVQGQFQSNPINVDNTGDWSVDAAGRLVSFDPIPETLLINYEPVIVSDIEASSWNVIPDPSTWSGAYAGLRIVYANGVSSAAGYDLYLPPRMPLGAARTLRRSFDETLNATSSPDAGDEYVFQTAGAADLGSTQVHYRYRLPHILRTLADETVIPEGFLYLWDEQQGTIVEGVTFAMAGGGGDTYIINAAGADLDSRFAGLITTGLSDIPSRYFSRFKLITVGTSLAHTVSEEIERREDHRHDPVDGDLPVSHSKLDNLVTPPWSSGYNSGYPPTTPGLSPSRWRHDDHLQYLHRAGSPSSSSQWRDPLDNAMFGDLVFTAQAAQAGQWLNIGGDSFGFLFGSPVTGPSIRYRDHPTGDNLQNQLRLTAGVDGSVVLNASSGNIGLNFGRLYLNGLGGSSTDPYITYSENNGLGIISLYATGGASAESVLTDSYIYCGALNLSEGGGSGTNNWKGDFPGGALLTGEGIGRMLSAGNQSWAGAYHSGDAAYTIGNQAHKHNVQAGTVGTIQRANKVGMVSGRVIVGATGPIDAGVAGTWVDVRINVETGTATITGENTSLGLSAFSLSAPYMTPTSYQGLFIDIPHALATLLTAHHQAYSGANGVLGVWVSEATTSYVTFRIEIDPPITAPTLAQINYLITGFVNDNSA